jgi:hypothetical protein
MDGKRTSMRGGWTVHVVGNPDQIYYAYVAERADAVEAVRKHVGAASGEIIEARRPIQSTVFEVLGIGKGKVSPA